jgi:hypothetical protein
MATLEQANSYNAVRGNENWSDLDTPVAVALLQDAEDYIRAVYPVRSDLTIDEQRIFDGIVCRLAAIFQSKPPQVDAVASIKKESKEGAGFKKEVEYNAASDDPYPYITAVIRPFLQSASRSGIYVGVVTG